MWDCLVVLKENNSNDLFVVAKLDVCSHSLPKFQSFVSWIILSEDCRMKNCFIIFSLLWWSFFVNLRSFVLFYFSDNSGTGNTVGNGAVVDGDVVMSAVNGDADTPSESANGEEQVDDNLDDGK